MITPKTARSVKSSLGYIYIATCYRDVNLGTHHYVKIGMTNNPRRRLSEYKTYDRGIVFIHLHQCKSRNMKNVEADVHRILTSIGCRVFYENEPKKGERFQIRNVKNIEKLIDILDYNSKKETPIVSFKIGKYEEIDDSSFPRQIQNTVVNIYDEDDERCTRCELIASFGVFFGMSLVITSICLMTL